MKRIHLVHPNFRDIYLVVGGGTCLFEFKEDYSFNDSIFHYSSSLKRHSENTLPFLLVESNECSLEKPSKPPIKATEQRPNNKGRGWSSCHCFFSSDVCFCCPDTFYTIEDQKFHLKVKFKVKD